MSYKDDGTYTSMHGKYAWRKVMCVLTLGLHSETV